MLTTDLGVVLIGVFLGSVAWIPLALMVWDDSEPDRT